MLVVPRIVHGSGFRVTRVDAAEPERSLLWRERYWAWLSGQADHTWQACAEAAVCYPKSLGFRELHALDLARNTVMQRPLSPDGDFDNHGRTACSRQTWK